MKKKEGNMSERATEPSEGRPREVTVLVNGVERTIQLGTATAFPVSRPALRARINRTLRRHGLALYATRPGRARFDLGGRYLLTFPSGAVWATHVDLEDLGRELGVLRADEHLADN
jgi:hypothetical protein